MTPLPRYLQIAEAIGRDIAAGRLKAGDRLAPERALAESHRVAVPTLRKALAALANRKMIERRHGSGTYVTGAVDTGSAYALFRLERHPEGGGLPSADLLYLGQIDSGAGLPTDAPAWRIRRLRKLDGVPVAVEDIRIPTTLIPQITAADLGESLYFSYRTRFDVDIQRAEDRIGVGTPPDWAPDSLTRGISAQFGVVERQAFDRYERLAEVSTTWFDPARARYLARVP